MFQVILMLRDLRTPLATHLWEARVTAMGAGAGPARPHSAVGPFNLGIQLSKPH